ncbi:MAG: RDD family protein [Acidimicrobiales bacterium]
MHCANCESETTGSFCAVCGTPTSATHATGVSGHVLAGWWRRVGATIVDNLILLVPTEIVVHVAGNALHFVVGDLAAILLEGIYLYVLLTKPAAQTLGNRAVGTRVRSALDGGPISPDQVLRRYGFVAFYSFFVVVGGAAVTLVGLCALIDSLAPLSSPTKQTLHDRFAKTIVVMG